MRHSKPLFLLAVYLLFSSQAFAQLQAPAPEPFPPEPPAPRVLMLVPDEFAGYVYVSRHRERETVSRFGEEALDLFSTFLRDRFSAFQLNPVRDESEARMMVSHDNPDPMTAGFDYVAIPRFQNVRYWAKDSEYGFDIDIVVAFYPVSGSVYMEIRGHGETTTGVHSGTSPGASGSLALRNAVDAVRDGVLRWQAARRS